ncbi:MAG: hypothetical protein KDC54_17915, partial [Lewinella sp.]|nr:hypothetical protein [Lewinella sp.]
MQHLENPNHNITIPMRKLILLLALGLGWQLSLLATPTIHIGDYAPNSGESFCVPVTVDNFTNINSLQFTVVYDPAVLTFTGASNFNTQMATLGNLGPGLFNETIPGQISFGQWNVGDCADLGNAGITLFPDGQVIFELCFTATGGYGQQTEICLGNAPMPILCTRNSTLCGNIGVLVDCGVVTLDVRPFQVFASQESDNTGEQVCMDFTVSGWDELVGVQFSVNWDASQLQFASLIPNDEDIPNNVLGAVYGTPGQGAVGPGEITVAWSYFVQGQPQPTIPDGTVMFTVCFNIIGDCETTAPVFFSSDPTPIEITNEDPANPSEGQEIPYVFTPGAVLIGDCDPTGLELNIDCGLPVEINDNICVKVVAGTNFQNVRNMAYLMEWNANILEFTGVQNFNLNGLLVSDFDTGNTENGILGLDWEFNFPPTGQNVAAGTTLYEVCFDVVGLGGDSPIQILTPGTATSNGFNIGVNPDNCTVQVTQPPGVLINMTDMAAAIGDTACVSLIANNFDQIIDFQFSLGWDDAIWTYTGVQNFHPNFTGASAANMMTFGSSGVFFDWPIPADPPPGPTSIPDGEALFEVCFTPNAPPAEPGDM